MEDSVKNTPDAALEAMMEISGKKTADDYIGWQNVDMKLLGYGGKYYPKNTVFKVKPFSTEEVIHFSGVNDNSAPDVEEALNFLIDNCVQVKINGKKRKPSDVVYRFDRLAFVLIARLFSNMETELTFDRECSKCGTKSTVKIMASNIVYKEDNISKYWTEDIFKIETKHGNFDYRPYTIQENKIAFQFVAEKIKELGKNIVQGIYRYKPFMRADLKNFNDNDNNVYGAFKSLDKKRIMALSKLAENYELDATSNISCTCKSCGHTEDVPMKFPNGTKSIVIDQDQGSDFLL